MQNKVDWLIEQLDGSPTPYQTVERVKQSLLAVGFVQLFEADKWNLEKGGRYFVIRRGTSIIAFTCGNGSYEETGVRMVGAHTDSPVLKVKPQPDIRACGYHQLSIEVYGGALLAPWFDRDLSIAGKVCVAAGDEVKEYLIDFKTPVAIIPSLAIHLDRTANEGRAINSQEQMKPILSLDKNEASNFASCLVNELKKQQVEVQEQHILEFDLSFYDTQGAAVIGLQQEFLASARLDNLLSSYVGLASLTDPSVLESDVPALLALFDHEEVGSQSDVGARSNFLNSVLDRLVGDKESAYRMMSNSALLSVDNAHGVHPNFRQKHDNNHGPILNSGPVVKYDANQGYATSAQSSLFLRQLALKANVPLQAFVTRADMRCGSTIGPMTAASLGVKTVDLGVPTFAMHSCRELAGVNDVEYLNRLLIEYLKTRSLSL